MEWYKQKIEKVPRGIQGEKSSKDKFEESGLNNWTTSKTQKGGTEPGTSNDWL